MPDDLTAEPAVSLSDDSNYNFDPLQPNGKKKPVRQPTKKELKKGKKEAKKEAKPAKKEAGKKGKKGKG